MSSDRVEVIYTAVDRVSATVVRIANAQAQLERGAANANRSVQNMGRGGGGIMGMVSNIANVGLAWNAVAGAARGAFGVIKKGVFEINASREQMANVMAGTIQAFGYAKTFSDARVQANGLFKDIRTMAAALPGETEDYLQVFKTALPQAIDAFKEQGISDLKEIAKFTSSWAAVTVSQGIDAPQAARDLRQMLAGRAGMDVRSFSEMQGFLRIGAKLKGFQQDIVTDAQTFNKLAAGDRLKIIQGTIEAMGGSLDNMANTSDALQGTFASIAKDTLATATAPLFEMYKNGLKEINTYLTENEEQIQVVAKAIGSKLVAGVKAFVGFLQDAFAVLKRIGGFIERSGMFEALQRIGGTATAGMNVSGAQGAAMGAGAAAGAYMGGPMGAGVGAVVGPAALAFAGNGDNVQATGSAATGLLTELASMLGPIVNLMATVGTLLGSLAGAILPPLLRILTQILGPVTTLFSFLYEAAVNYITPLIPALTKLVSAVMSVYEGFFSVLMPPLKMVASWIGYLAGLIGNNLSPVISWVYGLFSALAEGLGRLLAKIGSWVGEIAAAHTYESPADRAKRIAAAAGGVVTGKTQGFWGEISTGLVTAFDTGASKLAAANLSAATAAAAGVGKKAGAPGARGKTVYDFRNSKFDITQNFAEGFDPDRIAAVFGNDLAKLGEMRSQSGLAPLYGVR
jgi:hypothetical protein